MNLHILHQDPREVPKLLDDSRIGKMLMEANQMLSLAVKLGCDYDPKHVGENMLCFGFAYANHPVSIWVRQSRGNMFWTVRYAKALAKEFKFRFGRHHGSAKRTGFIWDFYPHCVPDGPRTSFQNSAKNNGRNVDFTHLDDVVAAYRSYMWVRWQNDSRTPKWTRREDPRPKLWESVREAA